MATCKWQSHSFNTGSTLHFIKIFVAPEQKDEHSNISLLKEPSKGAINLNLYQAVEAMKEVYIKIL
jgi:hypothetical protein